MGHTIVLPLFPTPDLSHDRARTLADELLMFQLSCQQGVVAKRRLCPELNDSPVRRTIMRRESIVR